MHEWVARPLSVDGLLIFCEEGMFRPLPVGLLLFTLSALMISHCFSNPLPHHTPPAEKQHYSIWKWGMMELQQHFNISLSLNTDRLSCLYLFSHHTQALRLSACQIHSTVCTALLPLACQMFICISATHFMPVLTPPASTVTLGRHLVKLYSLWWRDVLIPIPYFCSIIAATAVFKLNRVWVVWGRMCADYGKWKRVVSKWVSSRCLPSAGHRKRFIVMQGL